ncbi:MAG: hypothetical protein F4Y92_04290, partial [Dehalococcoidia bacterium]|nr:hypothetical protein [Dehalococcoidia bacterium]
MALEVVMPQMGADMTEGTLVRWLKQPGDTIERGDIIAEIETDKATVELEAFDAGVLRQVVAAEGDVVPVGEVIALLGDADEEMPEVERRAPAEKPSPRAVAVAAANADAVDETFGSRRVRVSPVARRIAGDAGIDLDEVTGSGPDGRILRRDVEAAIAARDDHAPA